MLYVVFLSFVNEYFFLKNPLIIRFRLASAIRVRANENVFIFEWVSCFVAGTSVRAVVVENHFQLWYKNSVFYQNVDSPSV